ncbi:MAG: TOBE domain-containing protein, partial [Actinomycetota bacterium]
ARSGRADPGRVDAALAHPYFARAAPKSLDRDAFAINLEGLSPEDGAATLRTADGELTVAPDAPVGRGARALATLKPIDVSLHAREPEGSARNVFRGTISEIAIDGDRARVRIDTRPPLTAEITAGSVARMGLRVGVEVWASFKAVEVSLQIESLADDTPPAGTLAR